MYIIAKIHDKNDCSVCTTMKNKLHKNTPKRHEDALKSTK
jgi:hypothetical protein